MKTTLILCAFISSYKIYAASEDVMKTDPEIVVIFNEAKEGHTERLEKFLKEKTIKELKEYKGLWTEEAITKLCQTLPEYDFNNEDFSSGKAIILKLLVALEIGWEDYYGSYLLSLGDPSTAREGCYWMCKSALKGDYMSCCNLAMYDDVYSNILRLQGSFREEDIWECADMMLKHLDKRLLTSEGKDTNPPEA
ncbi:MAG: hypothetical protein Q8Q56_05480 [Alphaproteobacteria bacterium]|nr:hypothetical protein [Alphaproteobacteria bacterium]